MKCGSRSLRKNLLLAKISLGHALIGCKIGEEVEAEIPAGLVKYKILEIS